MALSTIVKQTCVVCGKVAVEKSRINFGTSKIITLECGHVTHEEVLKSADYESIISSDGRKLMPYQVEGVKFLEQADARAILADEQGLGKTIQALATIRLHQEKLLPCIIVCPTTVKLQWHHEIVRWCGVQGFLTQVIASGKEFAAPGFDIYVTTYDLLKKEEAFKYVRDNIKLVILDEAQRIKNHLSDRAKAVQKICKNVEHIIPMSGTIAKNNAGELFTAFNLVRPRVFPQYIRFIEDECDSYNNGWGYKIGGLKNPEHFHEKTKEFYLRRKKEDVLKDLPPLTRKFFHAELDPKLNKAYAEALKELDDIMYDDSISASAAGVMKLKIYTKMRWATGMGKVDTCVDFITEFLMSNDRKLVVFAHHHDVVTILESKLNQWLADGGFNKVLNLHSGLNGDERAAMAKRFETQDYRVMIASTLAAGEGINLQFCSDAIMLERQWNPANEEQAEGRFHRFGQLNNVSVTYIIASETIDEYFTELVEQKRSYLASALDGKEIEWDQSSLLNELALILVTRGKKAWKI